MSVSLEEMEADAAQAAGTPKEKIAAIGKRLLEFLREKAKAEKQLSDLQDSILAITTRELPDAMSEAGVAEFKTEDGTKYSVRPFYSAKIDMENGEACHKWLNENGFGALIKNEVVASFDKGQDEIAKELFNTLQLQRIKAVRKEAVHYQTLLAFVKEKMQTPSEERPFPQELFKVYVGRVASVELPKT